MRFLLSAATICCTCAFLTSKSALLRRISQVGSFMMSTEPEQFHRAVVHEKLLTTPNPCRRQWQTAEITQYATRYCPSMFGIENLEENMKSLLLHHSDRIQSQFQTFVRTNGILKRDIRLIYNYHGMPYSCQLSGYVRVPTDGADMLTFVLRMNDALLLYRDAALFLPGTSTEPLLSARQQCAGWSKLSGDAALDALPSFKRLGELLLNADFRPEVYYNEVHEMLNVKLIDTAGTAVTVAMERWPLDE